jgi:hypothetical protein
MREPPRSEVAWVAHALRIAEEAPLAPTMNALRVNIPRAPVGSADAWPQGGGVGKSKHDNAPLADTDAASSGASP